MAKVKSRVFMITQHEYNTREDYDIVDGEYVLKKGAEPLITEDVIEDALNHRSIKKWAYAWHDKDTYMEEDETNDSEGRIRCGMKKPKHVHIVLKFDSAVEISAISRWFGVPENYIDKARGVGAFLDCVEYLTHEKDTQQALGKHLYKDNEIVANFAFRDEINNRLDRLAERGELAGASEKQWCRHEVMHNGKTIRYMAEKYPIAYENDSSTLDRLRLRYLTLKAKVPPVRFNYYISGDGGMGKGIISRALARNFYPGLPDEDIFFEIGGDKVSFEGYDGEPVIIWHDKRAFDILQMLGGRGNVFNVFDSHPTNTRQNIKYGSIKLVNTYNIVNSVEDFPSFINGLAGEYTDKEGVHHPAEDLNQSYRRFPVFINIRDSDFDMGVNRAWLQNSTAYDEYDIVQGYKAKWTAVRQRCANNELLARKIEAEAIKPVAEKHRELEEKQCGGEWTAEQEAEVWEEFKDSGKRIEPPKDEIPEGMSQMTVKDVDYEEKF